METIMTIESDAYAKHKNLKIAAEEIGIRWQTLYCRLIKQGVKVTGDKSRYGSNRDKLAFFAENHFSRIISYAKNMNEHEWQSKYDFLCGSLRVDVKCSMPRKLNHHSDRLSWAFSFKRQNFECELIVCFCFDENKNIEKILAIPMEFFNGVQTISVPIKGESKWHDYAVSENELLTMINDLNIALTSD